MDTADTIRKRRYINGMKLASAVQASITLVGLITTVIFGTWAYDYAEQLFTITQIILLVIFSGIAVYVNQKNYNYMLALVMVTFVTFPFIRQYIFELEYEYQKIYEIFGGKMLDWMFIWSAFLFIVGVLHARFYLALFIILYGLILTLYGVFDFINQPNTFFSDDPLVVSSEAGAMNFGVFLQNITITVFSAISLIAIAWMMERNLKEATEQEKSNNLLGRYFSPEVRDEIEKSNFNIDGTADKEQNIAVLFTDITDFTKLSEGLEPKEVLDLLSEYQTKMVALLFKNGGTVDKFIGDSVMATFGTPIPRGNDAQNALNCIWQMQIAMREWEKERSHKGLSIIKHRIGVHFGPCFVGNVGSQDRVEFTVIGDTVNVASRICEACKQVGSSVLISEEVKLRLSENLPTEEVKDFEVRGRNEKITLHKLSV